MRVVLKWRSGSEEHLGAIRTFRAILSDARENTAQVMQWTVLSGDTQGARVAIG